MGQRLRKKTTVNINLIALSVAFLTVCSWIYIPLTVPVTLQTFGVFTVVGLLGFKRGTIAVCAYILLGALGLPIFSGFSGGFAFLLGYTGGYVFGFIFSAITMGLIIKFLGKSKAVLVIAMIVGLLVCYFFGTAWFMLIYAKNTGAIGLYSVLGLSVFPFVIPDAAKIALAYMIVNRVSKSIKL